MDKLKKFLVKSKISTYAKGGRFIEKKLDNNGKELIFEEGSSKYRDIGISDIILLLVKK